MTPTVKRGLLAGWMAVTTLGVVALGVDRAVSDPKSVTFDTLTVQRLNVLEPDGKPRVIVASRPRFPTAYMGGKPYRHFNRDAGGFLFFNDEGDEVGGLIFDNNRGKGGATAMSGLSLDQYKQDETIVLNYSEYDGKHYAGLSVSDRPDWSIEPLLALSDEMAGAKTPDARAAVHKRMVDFATAKGGDMGASRLFAGREDGDALLRLSDKQGRPRLKLLVDAAGNASIELLDQTGKVARRITGD